MKCTEDEAVVAADLGDCSAEIQLNQTASVVIAVNVATSTFNVAPASACPPFTLHLTQLPLHLIQRLHVITLWNRGGSVKQH